MKAKAILICGKICCGKTTYTQQLKQERGATVLSCDELMLALFPEQLGDRHEEISQKAQAYLFQRAADLLELGVPVILEWGFWTKEGRRGAEEFFRSRGFETEWHYIEVPGETWKRLLEKRNQAASSDAYYVDPNLARKCEDLFEPPEPDEIDVWYVNNWTESVLS